MKKVIALVGMPGAGKSETAEFFKQKNVPILRFGDETDLGLKELGKEITQDNERWYREKLRKELGMAAYAIKIKPRIDEALSKNDIIILDGLYSWEEYLYLQKYFPNLLLLAVYARPNTRYTRLKSRPVRPLEPQKARERDIAELEKLNKGGPIALSDYLVINEGSLDQLHSKLQEFLQSLS